MCSDFPRKSERSKTQYSPLHTNPGARRYPIIIPDCRRGCDLGTAYFVADGLKNTEDPKWYPLARKLGPVQLAPCRFLTRCMGDVGEETETLRCVRPEASRQSSIGKRSTRTVHDDSIASFNARICLMNTLLRRQMKDSEVCLHQRRMVVAVTAAKFCIAFHVLQRHECRFNGVIGTGHGVPEGRGKVEESQHRGFAPHAARLDTFTNNKMINGDYLSVGGRLSTLSPFRLVLIGELPLLP